MLSFISSLFNSYTNVGEDDSIPKCSAKYNKVVILGVT
jgi:hypothetical protein